MLNRLNKILIVVVLILVGLFLKKVFTFKSWDRYYYISSVSNPAVFPIHIFDIAFLDEDDAYIPGFYRDLDIINDFQSDWGKGAYLNSNIPRFLPKKLFVEYMDFRTKNYYRDTVQMPLLAMQEVFNEAKSLEKLVDNSLGKRKLGLKFLVGIANDGHLVFWLTGSDYEKEFYRTQLQPKKFSNTTLRIQNNEPITDKEQFIENLFINIPDSVKRELIQLDVSNVSYKDSIPIYFKNM